MMRLRTAVLAVLLGSASALSAQDSAASRTDGAAPAAAQARQRASFQNALVHYGKWLTAGGAIALTYFAAHEHQKSGREWDALLEICRSSQQACATRADGSYIRGDAEQLYQRSRFFDRRANRRLLGAQGTLVLTAALFILDLHPGREGPENIPFSPLRVTAEPSDGGARLGLELRF
jgi:hypothetical protein